MDFYNQKVIEQYLLGKLEPKQRILFEKELDKDAQLQQHLLEQKKWFRVAENVGDVYWKNKIKALSQKVQVEEEPPTQSRIVILKRILAVAAVILFCIIGYLYLFSEKKTPQLLADQYFEPYTLELSRGDDKSIGNSFKQGRVYYNAQKFENALPFFEAIKTKDKQAQLAYGISLFETGQFESALKEFSDLSKKSTKYKNSALWYQALVYLKLSAIDQAKSLLQILSDGNSAYAPKAKKILTQL